MTLRGADLSAADLSAADLIDAGQDRRGYRFIGLRSGSGYIVHAGCRYLSRDDAAAHWADRHNHDPELHAEVLAKLDLIESVAIARGWVTARGE